MSFGDLFQMFGLYLNRKLRFITNEIDPVLDCGMKRTFQSHYGWIEKRILFY
jgi:hypothetical protein